MKIKRFFIGRYYFIIFPVHLFMLKIVDKWQSLYYNKYNDYNAIIIIGFGVKCGYRT